MGMIQQEAAQSEDLKYTIADVATMPAEQRTHNIFLAKKNILGWRTTLYLCDCVCVLALKDTWYLFCKRQFGGSVPVCVFPGGPVYPFLGLCISLLACAHSKVLYFFCFNLERHHVSTASGLSKWHQFHRRKFFPEPLGLRGLLWCDSCHCGRSSSKGS